MQRMRAALVVLGQKLGFVSRHVHLHRTLRLAGLATQAKRKRLVNSLALEAFLAQRAGKHLPQQPRAPARRVLFVPRRAIARAHHAALGIAAGANPHAPLCRVLKRAMIGGKHKMLVRFLRSMSAFSLNRVANILKRIVDAHCVRQLARVHPVVRIPELLECPEGLNQLRPIHLRQQRGARLPVAMLA